MPLTPEQSREVLLALHSRLRESPLGMYALRAFDESLEETDAKWQLLRFLDSLSETLAAAAAARVDAIIERLNSHVSTADHSPIVGVRVFYSPERALLANVGYIDLTEDPNLRAFADGVTRLRDDLRDDLGSPTPMS